MSFTLTPLLASRFLHLGHALKHGVGPLQAFGRRWDLVMHQIADGERVSVVGG